MLILKKLYCKPIYTINVHPNPLKTFEATLLPSSNSLIREEKFKLEVKTRTKCDQK